MERKRGEGQQKYVLAFCCVSGLRSYGDSFRDRTAMLWLEIQSLTTHSTNNFYFRGYTCKVLPSMDTGTKQDSDLVHLQRGKERSP
eukprot:1023798-Amphidinium_carterae.1